MSKTAVIHQPDFLPYLGFFERLLKADLYVVLDNVQFVNSSRSWHRRDKIKTPQGERWITVGVQKTCRTTKIYDVLLTNDVDWRNDSLNLIRENYRNAEFFNEIMPYVKELYGFQCEKMIDFNMKSIYMLMELFAIKIDVIFASELNPVGNSNELLVDILKKVKATSYLSGIGAKDYYVSEPFVQANIEVVWQDFKHPVYPQLFGNFIPYLSSIDLLFNCGIKESRQIIRSC